MANEMQYSDDSDLWVIRKHPDNWSRLMQYTGLHDKNGKEIYEGDVVTDGNKDLWAIRYSNEDMGFVFQNPTDKSNFNTMGWLQTNDLRQNEDSIFEVIGNVFENPELIKS